MSPSYYHHESETTPVWEKVLARILSHMRQKLRVKLNVKYLLTAGEVHALATVIHGHPTITSFESGIRGPYEPSDALYSALSTLPALESLVLSNRGLAARVEVESVLANPESLTELLRVPSLRSVRLDRFSFTPAVCQATASVFMRGTAFTKLQLRECSLSSSAGDCATILANTFGRNKSVSHIKVVSSFHEALIGALAAALPLNSTLQELSYEVHPFL
jgi:hypothetical protein